MGNINEPIDIDINEDDINIYKQKENEEKLNKTKKIVKNINPIKFARNNTYSEISIFKKEETISIIDIEPNNCKILEKVNLFNSVLIMMNNISFINEYFSRIETKEIIDKCENNNKSYCLSSILYFLNKCMWNNNNEKKLYSQKLFEKYNNYISRLCNLKKINPNLYLYNNKNVENILEEVYDKINKELSSTCKYKKKINKIQNDALSKYLSEFANTNKSKISDNFIGHFVTQRNYLNCKCIYKGNAFMNKKKEYYKSFYKLNFNIDEIEQYFKNKRNINNSNNKLAKFSLKECFDYKYDDNNKTSLFCEKCEKNNCIKQINIFIFPKILTIVFNNNKNYNFELKDIIKLNKYGQQKDQKHKNYENIEYNLISILCFYFKKYICYCINPRNGFWYSYTDGKIERVEKVDINAIPLIAIYQIKNEINFKYNKIIIEDKDRDNIFVEFRNVESIIGNFSLWFNKNSTIDNVMETISVLINKNKSNFYFLNNGLVVDKKQLLKDLIKKNEETLIFVVALYE